jgi:hypothetical protein
MFGAIEASLNGHRHRRLQSKQRCLNLPRTQPSFSSGNFQVEALSGLKSSLTLYFGSVASNLLMVMIRFNGFCEEWRFSRSAAACKLSLELQNACYFTCLCDDVTLTFPK